MKFFLVGNQKGGTEMKMGRQKILACFLTSLGIAFVFGGITKPLAQHYLFLEMVLAIAVALTLISTVVSLFKGENRLAVALGLVSLELALTAISFGLAHHDSGSAGVLCLIILGANLSYGGVVWLVRYLIQSRGQ